MNGFPKFKSGDKVKTSSGGKGSIESYKGSKGLFEYKVKMESGFTYEYKESDLTFNNDDLQDVDLSKIPDKCPRCYGEWKITKFGAKSWKDCPTCNRTAEDLCKTRGGYISKKDIPDSPFDDDDFGFHDWLPYISKP